MPKGEKTGLGRALVKHQMIHQSKEKGKYYRSQHKKVLESVTEISNIEAVIEQADEAHRLYSDLNPPGKLTINLPAWNAKMRFEELDDNESLEENENQVLTPFEKNLDIWRQLWRVLERSDLLSTSTFRTSAYDVYCTWTIFSSIFISFENIRKKLPIIFNRAKLAKYFHQNGILFLFWSAKAATAALEGKNFVVSTEETYKYAEDTKIYAREELLSRLQSEAEDIVSMRNKSNPDKNISGHVASRGVGVGFVGYPNVGKSSTINASVGEKKTGVTSTPGKTKHFQTLIISEKLTLCDCPGLVFPSFTSSRYEMIASGVLPIDRMTEQREAVQVVANRVPRPVIENVYKISLPKPKIGRLWGPRF